jgi:hypothetical protein
MGQIRKYFVGNEIETCQNKFSLQPGARLHCVGAEIVHLLRTSTTVQLVQEKRGKAANGGPGATF